MNSTNDSEQKQQLAERNALRSAEAKAYAVKRFGLKTADVIGYNSGNCYDKVWVRTKAAAEKVAAQVKGDTVNGGWFDGMALGGIQQYGDHGETVFEVMC